jgi:hypothetical protein
MEDKNFSNEHLESVLELINKQKKYIDSIYDAVYFLCGAFCQHITGTGVQSKTPIKKAKQPTPIKHPFTVLKGGKE